jgi:capsid assembly protein
MSEAIPPTPVIPDKFMKDGKPDYNALAQSYVELEKKLGTQPPVPAPAAPSNNKEPVTPPAAAAPQTETPPAFSPYEQEYAKDGKLSDKSYGELASKFNLDKSTVDSFIKFRQTEASSYETSVFNAVGGKDTYAQMQAWASKNYNDDDKTAFDKAIVSGNINTAQIALGNLKTRYEQANGRDPSLVGGSTGGTSRSPFKNPREAAAFKAQAGFNTDQAKQREYYERLQASQF